MSLESLAQLGSGGAHQNTRLPKILAELQGLTISGPLTGAAANTAIAVADGIEYSDTVLKALMFAAGVPSDITSTTSVVDRRATQTLTLGTVVAGNSCTVNGKVYTAVAFTQSPSNGAPAPYQFAVGSTPTLTAVNLAAAINAADPNTVIASSATNVVTLTARTTGTAGNSIATVSGTNITAGGATLAGGTATQAIKSTTNTTGNTVLLLWYKKTRVVGQW